MWISDRSEMRMRCVRCCRIGERRCIPVRLWPLASTSFKRSLQPSDCVGAAVEAW